MSQRTAVVLMAMGLMAPASLGLAAGQCERDTRTAVYNGKPMVVTLAKNSFTEVVFPEQLAAVLPERPTGLQYHENAFPDRLFFSVEDSSYSGLVILQGVSGESYHVQMIGHPACADGTVKIVRAQSTLPQPLPEGTQKTGRKLLEYMMTGETPPGYDREKLVAPLASRLVYQQGSVSFYLQEIYRGYNYTGTVLLAVNYGRVPFRIALEAIDYSSPGLRKSFGRVREVSMQPYNLRLGPAPEFASDARYNQHQGLIYIVSDNAEVFVGGQ